MVEKLEKVLKLSPIIPVVTIKKADDAVPLAEALLEGGISVIEITLRSEAALKAIASVSKKVSAMTVGAGTVCTEDQFRQVLQEGAQFVVSPGMTTKLASVAVDLKSPYLPGVATLSEIMNARDFGFRHLKFFPASLIGGALAIKQYSVLFSDLYFCPTGGIHLENMKEYLQLSKVKCVGGSWITPEPLIDAKDWTGVARLSKEAIERARHI